MNFLARTFTRLSLEALPLKYIPAYRSCISHQKILASPVFVERRQRLSLTAVRLQVAEEAVGQEEEEGGEENEKKKDNLRPIIDPETSIRYMKSKAYETTYRGVPVWVPYRRNHKGSRPPEKTRKTCVRAGVISTGNPCPICRDEYLVLHPSNIDLLEQFISPETGEVISYQKTGLCQVQHKKLLIAVAQAYDQGTIEMPVPFRQYDYSQYYPDAAGSGQN